MALVIAVYCISQNFLNSSDKSQDDSRYFEIKIKLSRLKKTRSDLFEKVRMITLS